MIIFFRDVFLGYRRDDCLNFSAVISFYAIFSVLPIAMISVSLLATFLGSSADLLLRFQTIVDSLVPGASDDFIRIVNAMIERKQRFSFISAGILVLIASFLFTALERALDRVFRTVKSRNFFHSRIVAVGFIFVFILLFAVPGFLRLARELLAAVPGFQEVIPHIMSGDTFFFFVAFAAFLLSVTLIPNHKVYLRYAFFGGVAFTALTGIARILFKMYIVASWSRYNLIYGSLTLLIVLTVWIYYLSNIYLLCAQIVARLQERFAKTS